MAARVPRGASGTPDQPNFRTDAKLTGLEIWLNGTDAELDAALIALNEAGRLLWRSTRRRLHGTGDQGRHSVHLRLAVAAEVRPVSQRGTAGADLIDLDAVRQARTSA
ncbi:hypothetical protein [Actinoplanes friuliensis]|uniref:Uncharacterized protein n=1 Tax=Actinoplanes friuliensis DSM 7358 TaxID=1246995 RepID=U5VV72_9ACTN|nr:hypothetical protein [Actinoplanes friuliensis]AGZ39595.1 hypothetical protein AFR_06530 [Actinoplanes friuliensis DSM 7358]